MKTLYISDLDGTLLDKNAKLSPRSAEIISRLIQNGLLFSVATARSQSCISILQQLDINIPCVQLNRMSFVYKFDSDCGINVEFEKLQNEVEQNFFNARKNQDYKSFRQVPNITASDDDRIIYFTMVDSYQRLKPIYEQIKTLPHAKPTLYRDNYSDLYFLEVFSSDATKANGVLKIKKMLNADTVVAFGDNLNDIDMLKAADIGVAVGDCVEEVRQYADIIIGNSYENGVAEFLLAHSKNSISGF